MEEKTFRISTKGHTDIINITPQVSQIVKEAQISEGLCLVSCLGSTCGLTTIEYEEGVISDLKRILDEIIPANTNYEHCKKWGDCNGYAHIRSAIIQPFLVVPIAQGELYLGPWQQIVFIDFDNRPREREIKITISKAI